MKSIHFPEVNAVIGKGQPQYEPLFSYINRNDVAIPATICLELSEEEISDIVKTKKVWLTQLTFGNPYAPILLTTIKQI